MAGNRIGRLIERTTCTGTYYTKDNSKQDFKLSVWGNYDVNQMTRKVRNILKTDRFLIDPDSLTYDEFWASMTLDKFVENADKQPHKPRKKD